MKIQHQSMFLTEAVPGSGMWNGIKAFDDAVYGFISGFISDNMTRFAKIMTFMGSQWVIIILTVLIPSLIFILRKKKYYRPGLLIPANIAFGALFSQILKFIFRRPRPEVLRLIEETGYSFPSGHSMNSVIFYGFAAYLLVRYCRHRSKYLIAGIIGVLIVLIGLSRIYLGVHYASDVLGGLLIGTGWLILAIRVSEKILK